jgi:YD repeat-containing protein
MRKKPPTVEMQSDGRVDGLKIAKRGQPGPPLWKRLASCRGERPMKLTLFAAILLAFATAAAAQSTFRDASGRTVGTVTTDSNGTRTFRDGAGHITGTATTDSNGTTTFRDASGRTTGTATSPRERERRMR